MSAAEAKKTWGSHYDSPIMNLLLSSQNISFSPNCKVRMVVPY